MTTTMDYLVQPGDAKPKLIDVVIPALNESETIGDVVKVFREAPKVGRVIVVNDLSKDRTMASARNAGAVVVKGPGRGKGQAMMRGLREVTSHRVIFADADTTGLMAKHAAALAEPAFGMIVGLRDLGYFNFLSVGSKLPPIAGERALPTRFARTLNLEGYGAETQINIAVAKANMRVWHFIMHGVTGKVRAGPARFFDVAPYARPELLHYPSLVRWLAPV